MRIRWAGLLVAASALVWLLTPTAPAASVSPILRVRAAVPFTVVGSYFQPFERVTVRLQGTWVRRAKANALGRFVVIFRGVDADVCEGFVLRAVGSKGSVAIRRSPPRECPSRNPG